MACELGAAEVLITPAVDWLRPQAFSENNATKQQEARNAPEERCIGRMGSRPRCGHGAEISSLAAATCETAKAFALPRQNAALTLQNRSDKEH
jgi:hypothetical protein